MDVLIVGGGGREHALAWKLNQSPRIDKLYIAPGNGGTRALCENVAIDAMDFGNLAKFVQEKKIDLTVVGPDDPLASGIVDFFQSRGLRIFGPSKDAAQIEASKVFSKQLMAKAKIPTAEFKVFNTPTEALAYVRLRGVPIVIKAKGLALGKGVYVCRTMAEVEVALDELMVKRIHKDSGDEVVVEEFLDGPEVSIHALSDGLHFLLFPPAQDHKPALDGDKGKNTGGMGTIAPVPWMTPEMMQNIEYSVLRPTLETMKKSGTLFTGLLFPGIKMTVEGPKVLEFNARFGDPEAQVYMRLLGSDLLDLLEACIDQKLDGLGSFVKWNRGFAVNIVIASGGYPDAYEKGFPITGIEEAEKIEGVVVFHAGTKVEKGQLVTTGGRVLGVSAVGDTLQQALGSAYEAVGRINFKGMQFRRDIGAKALIQ
ncbi:phosphoribosylamine--glycine ligase [Candidatus Kaiserbacteria bacterium RIFCSPHIGHO2_12_FULL_53_13]|uniref:Phosphoribosylamine--glycine ligase n=1 Tax=Candidatus Kaiserbacteria bacterium RIFCSPHIGHO2_12_FULL_53_13 TaxID=1798502 RepID=A0A1F6E6A5_9BACT|nr:MAG: phosphoribosylamine--glycine ligase [Candidatus Kaiserbacteria bacterium RIFCSPHIGHO2_12_FULL_53_13]OGG74687.1 MAG: phosphoribosylamine--glycine ligase [Candidatus Kaiserbacteria bacterium RIFCSPLOWO2_01_FULL_52_36]